MDEEVRKALDNILAELGDIEKFGDSIATITNALNASGTTQGSEDWKERYESLRKDYINRFMTKDIAETVAMHADEDKAEEEGYSEPDISDLDFDGRSE